MAHTAMPYRMRDDCSGYIDANAGEPGAIGRFYSLDDCAFAVRAINAHDDMVDALKDALEIAKAAFDYTGCSGDDDWVSEAAAKIEAVLARAEA